MNKDPTYFFAKEYWTGDSRDGMMVNGDGYHYYKLCKPSLIIEAFEFYETDDGREVVNPLPEMLNVDWIKDLGFDDLESLDIINENEFLQMKEIAGKSSP